MIRIFLLAGQSNMVGAGVREEIPTPFKSVPKNVRFFEGGGWKDLLWRDRFGPEIGLAHRIAGAFPDDAIVLCKVAASGANLYYDWNPDGTSRGPEDEYRGPLYPKLMEAVRGLKTELAGENDSVEISATVWMQGERDSVFEFMAEAYGRNLRDFIACLRRDTGNGELPFLIGQIAPRSYLLEEGRFRHGSRKIVQEAQRRVAASDSSVELIEALDLPQSDNLHFDTGGQLELGKRFAEAYLQQTGLGRGGPQ